MIRKWHSDLIGKAKQRDSREGRAVKYILRYLEKSVFEINQTKRDGVDTVEKVLRDTFQMYKQLAETSDEVPENQTKLPSSVKPLYVR